MNKMICKSRQYAFQFAQPEDQTRREDDENPVHRGKGYYAEHASAKSRDDDLSHKNQQGDEDEALAPVIISFASSRYAFLSDFFLAGSWQAGN